ncbi:MAG: glycosyltransferase family 1 protein [Anaerolineales bacterium]|nr:glycosyltransferase family 1 protein [Anaerolineales bacterium]
MNITILTYGSRGDVQPFLPLSRGLMDRGHQVILAAPLRFKNLVEEHGITFAPLAGDPEELSRRLNDSGYNYFKMIRELMNHAVNIGAEVLRQTEEACKDTDLIIHTFTHAVGAHTLAREKNIPDIHIQTFPMFTPTGDYPNIAMPNLGVRTLNHLSHVASSKITWLTSRMGFEQVRRRAGLPKRKLFWPFDDNPPRLRTPILCAWSPSILPISSDWPPRVHVTGYFFFPLDESYSPPNELDTFLKLGKSPVCVSFGSMVNKDAKRINDIVVESLKKTNNRGIILSGWGGVKNRSSNDLLYLESAPHDWLLPRCKMIIHHGGAGTTAAGLRAGIPNIVVPFTADQPFWGNRVHTIGVGPKPILVKNISVDKLVRAIAEAESNMIRDRAQVIGQNIRSENGIADSIKAIEVFTSEFKMNVGFEFSKRV